ncbi:MAG: caspase family protein [bacterium]|nr:caspase family protein [bacterium]
MNSSITLSIALLLTFVAGALPSQNGVQRGGQRRALLIGINDYRDPQIPDLRGCVNDVALMAHVLESRYGFDEIERLTDAQATRAAILAALERAVSRTGRDDFLFVHYSGHGSQQADHNGDEKDDGLDETLVAYDSRTGDVIDIVDDEIDAILARLATGNAVISFDACHSGTGTRDRTELRTRDVPPDARGGLYAKVAARRLRGNGRYLVISSALANERALDGPVAGVPHGLFSRALARVLSEQPLPGEGDRKRSAVAAAEQLALMAYGDIVEGLGCSHRASTPTFELVGFDKEPASARRRWQQSLLPVPRPGRGARLPWLGVRGELSQVELVGGTALGALPGTCWAIYPPGETTFERGRAIAWGEVVEAGDGKARLELEKPDGKPIARSLAECRAVRIADTAADEEVPVKLMMSADEQDRARALLQKVAPGTRALGVGSGKGAGFVIRRSSNARDFEVLAGDEQTPVTGSSSLADAARVIGRTLRANRLLTIRNPTSELGLRVWTDLVGGAVEDREIGVMRPRRKQSQGGYRVYREGDRVDERNCVQVHVELDQDAYLTVVNVDGSGKIGLLFPNELSEENGYLPGGLVRGMERVSIPDAVSEDCAAGFLLPLLTPGRETIRVFATTELATAETIRAAVREAQEIQRTGGDIAEIDLVLETLRDELAAASSGTREVGVMGVKVVKNKRRRPASADAGAAGAADAGAGEAHHEEGPESDDGDWAGQAFGDWTAASITFAVRSGRK